MNADLIARLRYAGHCHTDWRPLFDEAIDALSAQPKVTDAQVEAACNAFIIENDDCDSVAWRNMRAALEAAQLAQPDARHNRATSAQSRQLADVEALRALVAKWRLFAAPMTTNGPKAWKRGLLLCAGELDAILANCNNYTST